MDDRGPDYWKFNYTLTKDPVLFEQMKETYNMIASSFQKTDDFRVNWEFLKFKMKQFAREYSMNRQSREMKKDKILGKRFVKWMPTWQKPTKNESFMYEYDKVKDGLNDIFDYITEGAILSSKA